MDATADAFVFFDEGRVTIKFDAMSPSRQRRMRGVEDLMVDHSEAENCACCSKRDTYESINGALASPEGSFGLAKAESMSSMSPPRMTRATAENSALGLFAREIQSSRH